MNGIECGECGWPGVTGWVVCPRCGARQDEKARQQSVQKTLDAWIVFVPIVVGLLGGACFDSVWAVLGGLAAGLTVGIGILTAKYIYTDSLLRRSLRESEQNRLDQSE